jgi:serine/threonine-protein kinase
MAEREAWRTFSEQLDRALALAPEERAAWLAELERTAPENAQRLRAMLDSAAAIDAEGFLAVPTRLAEAPSGLLGARVGPWVVESEIGRGGMSSVWRARRSDGRYEGTAAIKFVSFAALGREGEARFRREGLLLGRLAHPNIARLLDAGVYGETRQPYLVLEFVDGVAIDEHCERAGLGARERIALFQQVLEAVSHAHGHLIVHRDLKPSNILVSQDGAVKLLDFGIAKLLEGDEAFTRSGVSALTPQYAAPEQVLGEPITTRTDLYALGLVLYRLFTGRHARAFEGGMAELQRAVLGAELPPPSACAPGIPGVREALPGDLDNIVMKALRRAPEERYATAAAFADDLAHYLRYEPVTARPATLSYRAAKFVRRNRGGVASAALVTLALIAAFVATTAQMLEARRQRDIAQHEVERAAAQANLMDQVLTQLGDEGEPLSQRLLTERSVAFVESQYADKPEFAVGFLIHLSGRYMNLGDTRSELETLDKAKRIAERSGDPALLARAECNAVETELQLGRPDAARQRLERGTAALARSREPHAQLRFDCAYAAAKAQHAAGETQAAIATALEAERLLRDSDETLSVSYPVIVSFLIRLYSDELDLRSALRWSDTDLAVLERGERTRTEHMVGALHSRSRVFSEAGEWRDALALEREAIARLIAAAPKQEPSQRVSGRLALYLLETGATDEALSWIARAAALAERVGDELLMIEVTHRAARAHLQRGDLAQAAASLSSARESAQKNPIANRYELTEMRTTAAELALARGDAADAARLLEQTLRELGYPATRKARGLVPALLGASSAALALGDPQAAAARANEALSAARPIALDPARSAAVGDAWLALARAQRAEHADASARESAARAVRALRAGRGSEHAHTREAIALSAGAAGGSVEIRGERRIANLLTVLD